MKINPLLLDIVATEFKLFGKFGNRLRAFVQDIDLTHPDLPIVYEGFFAPGNLAARKIHEAIKIYEYAKSRGYNEMLSSIESSATSRLKNVYKNIDTPLQNKQSIRLLKSVDDRNRIRKQKEIKPIDLSAFLADFDFTTWNNYCSDFSMFEPGNKKYLEEIEPIERKAKKFLELGCNFLYDGIKKDIDNFKKQFEQDSCGFSKIKMMQASVILAKISGFSFDNGKLIKEKEVFEPIVSPVIHLNKIKDDASELIQSFDNKDGYTVFDQLLAINQKSDNYEFLILLGEKDNKCYFIKLFNKENFFNFDGN